MNHNSSVQLGMIGLDRMGFHMVRWLLKDRWASLRRLRPFQITVQTVVFLLELR
jgi:6-phosphogluconate dehydrogenase (decarboxylating)